MEIYCNTCEKNIDGDSLVAQFSESDPGCPSCGNTDFSDATECPPGYENRMCDTGLCFWCQENYLRKD